jgi:hemoglobin/transferrin/lactoferrin receptor protein
VKGIYVQDVFEINDQLTFSTGVRFDDYELKDVNGQNFKDSGFSFNASTNYAITDEVSISAGYAEALRGAEVKDAFKLSSSSNADDLEAEKAKNYEIGLDFNRGSLNLAVGAYLNEIENPIGGTLPWSRVSENLDDDIETLGYFIRADYVYERLFATANFNSATTKTDKYDATRYIHGSTATSKGNTLVTDVSYDLTQGFMVGWAAEFVQSMGHVDINLDDDDGKQLKAHKPGYSVHDVYTRWSPMSDDTFSLTLTVKNMFNKQYLDHSSVEDLTSGAGYENIVGSSGSGRDIRMTASLRI